MDPLTLYKEVLDHKERRKENEKKRNSGQKLEIVLHSPFVQSRIITASDLSPSAQPWGIKSRDGEDKV